MEVVNRPYDAKQLLVYNERIIATAFLGIRVIDLDCRDIDQEEARQLAEHLLSFADGGTLTVKPNAGWTQEPPTEQGTYWHWNGDRDSAPLPTFVMYSGFTGKCFVSMGQLGLQHAVDCGDYGGWWKPLPDPKLPEVE